MDLEQLTGRYRRLKGELAAAYGVQPWPAGRIDRLAQEIAEAEQALFGGKAKPQRASRDGSQPAQVERHRITPFGQRTAEPAVK
ncbi:MAG: hypothetical protein ABI218_07435 [Caldimonas sp.]